MNINSKLSCISQPYSKMKIKKVFKIIFFIPSTSILINLMIKTLSNCSIHISQELVYTKQGSVTKWSFFPVFLPHFFQFRKNACYDHFDVCP